MSEEDGITRVALVTYNRIGNGEYPNGVIEKEGLEVYLTQNVDLAKWAVPLGLSDSESIQRRVDALREVFLRSRFNLEMMDHIYFYVGKSGVGVKESVRLTEGLSNITYVMCGCNWNYKRSLINRANPNARVIYGECGGRQTMRNILREIWGNNREFYVQEDDY